MNYPNGKKFIQNKSNSTTNKIKKSKEDISFSSANRGMNLENAINLSNEYYLQEKIALITKRPTPINVVKVDYTHGARITDAYFEKQSTTDYNGIYRSKYIDIEAKNTKNKTSFPLANIEPHQITHLQNVIAFNGLAFFIIQFQTLNEVYLLKADYVIDYYINSQKRSITINEIRENGIKIKEGYLPRLDYIKAIDEIYFDAL